MLKFLGRTAAITLLLTAIAAAVSIVTFLIVISLLGEERVIEGITCHLGVSETCLRQELMIERAKLEALQGRNDEMEALLERLSSLDHAASSYVVFLERRVGSRIVQTGHTYASLLDPNTLTSAHCYFQQYRKGSAGHLQFNLDHMDAAMRVTNPNFTETELRNVGLSPAEMRALQNNCQWPEGAS
ncbi:MAG: hypothetical protein ACSHWS_17415 [Sulfitobacter sp.]